ncbi:hypothetical protein KPATCC21470_8110 [Kitasatospora purpeofusca]
MRQKHAGVLDREVIPSQWFRHRRVDGRTRSGCDAVDLCVNRA